MSVSIGQYVGHPPGLGASRNLRSAMLRPIRRLATNGYCDAGLGDDRGRKGPNRGEGTLRSRRDTAVASRDGRVLQPRSLEVDKRGWGSGQRRYQGARSRWTTRAVMGIWLGVLFVGADLIQQASLGQRLARLAITAVVIALCDMWFTRRGSRWPAVGSSRIRPGDDEPCRGRACEASNGKDGEAQRPNSSGSLPTTSRSEHRPSSGSRADHNCSGQTASGHLPETRMRCERFRLRLLGRLRRIPLPTRGPRRSHRSDPPTPPGRSIGRY